jgi:hypothetical protein
VCNSSIKRLEIPQPITQSKNEITISTPIKKFTFHRLISQISKKATLDTTKKRKHTSLLKQLNRFIARTDPIRHIERNMQMLEKAKTYLIKK